MTRAFPISLATAASASTSACHSAVNARVLALAIVPLLVEAHRHPTLIDAVELRIVLDVHEAIVAAVVWRHEAEPFFGEHGLEDACCGHGRERVLCRTASSGGGHGSALSFRPPLINMVEEMLQTTTFTL